MDNKQIIRSKMIELRNNYSNDEVINKSEKIANHIFRLPEFQEAKNVLLYADYRHEVMTKTIFDECILNKKRVFFPKCIEDNMEFYQVVSVGALQKGAFGILEPNIKSPRYVYANEPGTLAIIPGVAFDVKGNRLGYGKGFYDRFLDKKPFITKVGICYNEQIVEELPSDKNDILMDKIVTDNLAYSFLRI